MDVDLPLRAAFDQSPFGMVVSDLAGIPVHVNRAACRLLGFGADDLVGVDWLATIAPGDRDFLAAALDAFAAGDDGYGQERCYVRPDGTEVWIDVHLTVVRDAAGRRQWYMAQFQDVTDRHRAQAELAHRAMHDDLTGLPNRALLTDRLRHALATSARNGGLTAIAFFDLDGFKDINDTLGHGVGDQLLVQVADRLRQWTRATDTVARFGGDEFVVVCGDGGTNAAVTLGARLERAMASPFSVAGRDVALHASIGITASRPGSTAQSVLSEADAAMYRAKELGRHRVAVFDDSLRDRSARRLEAEQALRAALRADGIVTHFQPVVDLGSGRTVGVEALVRWSTADGRLLAPAEFVPLAESTGIIVDLGGRVLADAVAQAARWNVGARDPLYVSVNLSAPQLTHPQLPAQVAYALESSGLRPDLLHLEITETVLMEDVATSIAVLDGLKRLGVGVTIDDFGTGYSSLAYLRQLPVDELKIDRSFVRHLGDASADASIVEAVVGLARALRLGCVAEGVESTRQLDALRALGCTRAQGHLWAPALPAEDAAAWLGSLAAPTPVG